MSTDFPFDAAAWASAPKHPDTAPTPLWDTPAQAPSAPVAPADDRIGAWGAPVPAGAPAPQPAPVGGGLVADVRDLPIAAYVPGLPGRWDVHDVVNRGAQESDGMWEARRRQAARFWAEEDAAVVAAVGDSTAATERKRQANREAQARYRARQAGHDVSSVGRGRPVVAQDPAVVAAAAAVLHAELALEALTTQLAAKLAEAKAALAMAKMQAALRQSAAHEGGGGSVGGDD